ncbi:MAG: polysaccharide deacetylase family protein [Asticcacaulis sp.]
MKIFAIAVASSLAATAVQAAPASGRFDIAITVDDLPVHAALPARMTRAGIAEATIAALKAHYVPQAWGFINAQGLKSEPDSAPVLNDWRAAGFPLGNHTFSHMALSKNTLAAWQADFDGDEPVLSDLMGSENHKFLRFPFLDAGNADNHDAAIAWLKARGYRIADVSVSFSDWAYSDAYARCTAKGDAAAITAMKTQYMNGVRSEITRMKALSAKVYGRMIPQVLLTHIGGFSAVMLPQVLDELDKAGAHYVTLEQAESDPAYAETDAHAGAGTVMERTAGETGVDISAVPGGASIAGVDQMCR